MRYVMIVVLMLGSLAVAGNPECQKARETIGEISPAVIMGEWNQTEVLAVLSQLESCQINAIRQNDGEAAVEAAIAENALLVDMYNRLCSSRQLLRGSQQRGTGTVTAPDAIAAQASRQIIDADALAWLKPLAAKSTLRIELHQFNKG